MRRSFMASPDNLKTRRFLTGQVPLEDEFCGFGALRSVAARLLHTAARILPMHPQWRVLIHRWRGVKIGNGVFIGSDVFIDNTYPDSVTIEDDVCVTSGCFIVGHYIYPLHLRKVLGEDRPVKKGVTLKKGCYIAPKCIITDGVVVGECAIIGAGSVVTKSIPPYSIALGVPAKVVRTFSEDEVDYVRS
jgi:acetyltransferase-like isoleucine patch superfamily enzyme